MSWNLCQYASLTDIPQEELMTDDRMAGTWRNVGNVQEGAGKTIATPRAK